mgnify:CR=1 FL=1
MRWVRLAPRRAAFAGPMIVAGAYTKARAEEVIGKGQADLVAFGRPFISTPDLVRRLQDDLPFNELRADKLYGGGAEGYTDYPVLAA